MAIKYDPSVEETIKLGYSAIVEACISLCDLTFPELNEGRQRRLEELSDLLPASLLDELVEFGTGDGDYWIMPSEFFDFTSFRPYPLEIARVRALSADEIHEVIVEHFKSTYESPVESEVRALEEVARYPVAWRDHAMNLLERFQPYFQPIWEQLEPAFASALERVEQLRKTKPLYEWLPALDNRVSWDPLRSQLLTVGSIDETLDFTPYSEFGVVPTYFGDSTSWTYSSRKERKMGVVFVVPDARSSKESFTNANSQVPDALINTGELGILEILNKQPATTSELAIQAEVDERTAASRLKKLEQAGLVRPLGEGKSSRYRKWQADKDRVRETLHALELRLLGD